MNLCKKLFMVALIVAPSYTFDSDELVGRQANAISDAIIARPAVTMVQPLTDLSIYTAQIMLCKAIKRQEIIGTVSKAATAGTMFLMMYALGNDYFKSSRVVREQFFKAQEVILKVINAKLKPEERLTMEDVLQNPSAPQQRQGWVAGAFSLPLSLAQGIIHQAPLLIASIGANAILNKLQQYTEEPGFHWFIKRYVDTDRLWLQIFETAVTLDYDSALLQDAQLGHLQNRPEGLSGFSGKELIAYLKTISFTADVAQKELSCQVLSELVSRLRAQYALLIAFCQLQQMDASRAALVKHQAFILMNSFNGMAQIINNLHEKDLLQALVVAVNKIQYSERTMIYAAFPQLAQQQ